MRSVVLDASVAASWYIPKQATAPADALLAEQPRSDWLAPFCFRFEVGNLLLRQEKRGVLKPWTLEIAFDELRALGLQPEEAPDEVATASAIRLARRHGVSLFDGFYLDLAFKKEATLATRDGLLITAATSEGCSVQDLRAMP